MMRPCHWLLVLAAAPLGALACRGETGTTEPPGAPVRLVILPATPRTLRSINDTLHLTAEARDARGRAVPGVEVTWEVGSAAILGISPVLGAATVVTALGNGRTTVRATGGGFAGSVDVTVAQEFAGLTVLPTAFPVQLDNSRVIHAQLLDGSGSPLVGASAAAITWTSSNDAVVELSGAQGVSVLVTGKALGGATVTATATIGGASHSGQSVATVSLFAVADTTWIGPGDSFGPDSMDIAAGGSVLFVNTTNTNHNVSFPQLRPIGGDVATARQFGAIRFFIQPGRYPFQCTIHPGMTGVVVVH